MSYRAFKRLLGETSLERKCRFLFGAGILLLITASFWWYARQTEGLAYEQTQTTGVYRMPIEVRITTSAPPAAGRGGSGTPAAPVPARSTHVVQLTQQRQTFSLPSDREPSNVELDPDAWTVMQATFVRK